MKKNETKMTVKVPTALYQRFVRQLDELSLKKAAFLTSIIESELPHLRKDLDGKKLSSRGRRHIAGALKKMGTTTVNVVLTKQLARSLTQCVQAHGIVRDAFVSRLIALLRSEPNFLEALDLPARVEQRQFRALVQDMPTSPLKAMEEVRADPFYYLRVAVEERQGTGLYTAPLPRRWDGLACFLPDEDVPSTPAWKARQAHLADL